MRKGDSLIDIANIDITAFDWIAIYGAMLSTILLIFNIRKYKRDLKISMDIREVDLYPYKRPTSFLIIKYVNKGKRVVQIDSFGFKLSKRKQLIPLDPVPEHQYSIELEDGDSDYILFHLNDIAKKLKEIDYSNTIELKGFIKNTTGNIYYSNKIKFNVDQWLNYKSETKLLA